MRVSPSLVTLLSILSVSSAAVISPGNIDVSKGTDVIPPDSKEAEALHAADKASKFAPKDNTFIENFDKASTFKKPEPKVSDQKIDVPDNESLTPTDKKKKVAATKDDKNPVVVNDYDPNNMGVSSEGKTKAQEHADKDADHETLESTPKVAANEATESLDHEAVIKNDPTSKSSNLVSSKVPTLKPAEKITPYLDEHADKGHALLVSISMTVLSEIGDKTFLIAAIMAMKYKRITVFTSAYAALVLMSVVSGVIGHAVPKILSRKTSAFIAGALFTFFGVNLLREAFAMDKNTGVEEELEEVESEINATAHTTDLELGLADQNEKKNGINQPSIKRSASNPRISEDGLDTQAGDASLYIPRPRRNGNGGLVGTLKRVSEGLGNLFALILSPVWVQCFAMTFFAEWGDRSQIATVAMAAGSDYLWVIVGTIFGHFLCTLSAVIGGKLLASRITLKNVSLTGGFLFLIFALVYFYEFFST